MGEQLAPTFLLVPRQGIVAVKWVCQGLAQHTVKMKTVFLALSHQQKVYATLPHYALG